MKIILLHWLGQNSESWNSVIEGLWKDVDIYCPDLFDLCEDKNVITFDSLYQCFKKYCEQFNEPVFLCGLSLWGVIALKYAIEFPEKIFSIMIISARMTFPKILMTIQVAIMYLLLESGFLKIWLQKKSVIWLLWSIKNIDFTDKIQEIKCPVCVVCWEKDFFNKEESRKIAQKISNSKLIFVKNAKHEVNKENPVFLAQEIKKFL